MDNQSIPTLKKDTNHGKSYFVYECTMLFSGLPYDYTKFY